MSDWFTQLSNALANTANTVLADNAVTLTSGQVQLLSENFLTYLQDNTPQPFTLSNIQPDFELILSQMMQSLSTSDAWTDQITAGSGQAMLRFMSGATMMAVFAVLRALQEANLPTARLASSVYTICNMLGIHLLRKSPASTLVTLNYSAPEDYLEISPLTQFTVGGIYYFNRDPIIFQQGTTSQTATLYQGTLITETLTVTNTTFQTFTFGNQDFSTADTDVYIFIDNQEWTRITNGLWHFGSTDQVFMDTTTNLGAVTIQFGNGLYGLNPDIDTTVDIVYAQTLGSSGNQLASGQTITCASYSTISGTNTTASNYGADQRDAAFYQIMAPFMYATQNRCVTADDYRAMALQYPTVVDCIVLGQANTLPYALERMCVVDVILLTSVDWDSTYWLNFTTYMATYGIVNVQLLQVASQSIIVDIDVDLYVNASVNNLNTVNSAASQALINLMSPGVGSLGWSMYESDIFNSVKTAVPQLVYLDINTPASPVILGRTQYVKLGKLTVNSYYSTRNTVVT